MTWLIVPVGSRKGLPRAQALELWASQTEASTAALKTPSRYAAWRKLPSRYFIASDDEIITMQSQLAIAKRAHSNVTILHRGSHVTLISHPTAVTAVIRKALSSPVSAGA